MRAAAMSVWVFINLVCFGMCGYLYLIWSQYWMHIERQRLLNQVAPPKSMSVSYQDQFISKLVNYSSGKKRRSAIGAFWSVDRNAQNTATFSQIRPSNNVVRKEQGSPRFPNLHKPVLEFDTDKFICDDYSTLECEMQSKDFKELILKEFHRVLMGESNVFKSGLDIHNQYDVKYKGGGKSDVPVEDIFCSLSKVKVETVTDEDEPFGALGFNIPKSPLLGGKIFNTCAVVTSAGSLLGSKLGLFIDSHDMVLRFNNAPTENFTDDVGHKTTFRILNSQVVSKPEFGFLSDNLYKNISILIWDPANYSSTLEKWYEQPDFPLFPVYKRFLELRPNADVHLLKPRVLWDLWSVLQDSSPYRLRRNPPSSGFIGLWFSMQRCKRVRVFEYVPSARASLRCHYHRPVDDIGCTLGVWHPLAQEKLLAERLRNNTDVEVFQKGYIENATSSKCSIDVPSARASLRCHYHRPVDDIGCTLGVWHPLAQEKLLAERLRNNTDVEVFQKGYIEVPGVFGMNC